MQIEEGKYYKSRDGQKFGPMIMDSNGGWPWTDNSRGSGVPCWARDGRIGLYSGGPLDLIAEWEDEPIGPVRTRTVTEIVDGNYGVVMVYRVNNEVRVELNCSIAKAEELRAAADVFIQLADALEGK